MSRTPIENKEAGLTLVEMMISIAIGSVLAFGGYQMLIRSQKYLAYKKIDQTTQTEVDQLLNVIKKDWDYRMRESIPNIPESGVRMLTATGTECFPSATALCPKLRLWIRRTVSGTALISRVTIENICQKPTDADTFKFIAGLDYASNFQANCHSCPKGQIPAVRISGVNETTGVAVLGSENRIFPFNASDSNLGKVSRDNVLGMQTCFSQLNATAPMTVDLRAVVRDQSSTKLRLLKKNQVYPFENFAGIKLEQ